MGLALASQFEQCPTGTRLLASLYGICSGSPVLLSAMGLRVPDGAILKLFWCSTENVLSRRTETECDCKRMPFNTVAPPAKSLDASILKISDESCIQP